MSTILRDQFWYLSQNVNKTRDVRNKIVYPTDWHRRDTLRVMYYEYQLSASIEK